MVDGPQNSMIESTENRAGVSVLLAVERGLGEHLPTLAAAVAACGAQDQLLLLDRGLSPSSLELADWADSQSGSTVVFVPSPDGFQSSESVLRSGLDQATSEYVLLLSAGRLLQADCLNLLVSELEKSPRLAAVAPLAQRLPGRQDLALQGLTLEDGVTDAALAAQLFEAAGATVEVEGLAPDCLLIRRSALEQAIAAEPESFFASRGYRLPQLLRSGGQRLGLVQAGFVGRDPAATPGGAIQDRTDCQRLANHLWEEVRRRLGSPPDASLYDGNLIPPQIGLASIVVLVWDNLEVTRECLASLYRETLRPFELIVIDNGSGPQTATFLDQMANHYDNVVLVRNEENQGYAYGCNQGLAAANGDYLVLLNNDVVVTPHWLSDQIALFTGHPEIGLVGPRTNESAGPQLVPAEQVHYSGHDELPAFSERWSRSQALNFTYTDPLTGLCMVLQRSLVRKIGGLDTSFWLGNLEDNDFCIRIARAGYKMALAHDVFVHHEGSSTFKAQKIDYQGLLARNWEFFCSKWSFERPLGTGFPTQQLVENRPFQAAFDYIPPQDEEIYRPGLEPIDIVGAPARTVLMIPELEGDGWQKPFADFMTTFGPGEGIGLLLRVDPPTPRRAERAVEAVTQALAELGLAEGEGPDIILDTTQLNPGERGRLYSSAEALLCCEGSRAKLHAREAKACGLPMLQDLGSEGLRLRLDAMGEALGGMPSQGVAAANGVPVEGQASATPQPSESVPPLRPVPTGDRPGVSIVIVTYNSAESIGNCLTSLKMHCGPSDQVIVVDNVSGDATRTMLRKRRDTDLPDLHLIFADNNLGFSRGVNLGLEQAKCELVLMLNPDTVITRGALDAMAAVLTTDPQVGAVGPTSDYAAGMQNVGQHYSGGPIDAESLAETLRRTSKGPLQTNLLIGFCLMMWTEKLSDLGGLDPELFLGNDDLDLSLRLGAEGLKLLIATDAFVHHKGQVSFATEPKQRTSYLVGQSTNLLYSKLYRMLGGDVPEGQDLWDVSWFKPQRELLSVVVVLGDDADVSAQCLSSLVSTTHRDIELILVARTETATKTAKSLIEEQPGVVHLQAPAESSAGEALNLGLGVATGTYLLLSSDDVLYPRGSVEKLLALLGTREEWGMVGPRCPFSSGAQGLPPGSEEAIAELEQFAWFWHESEAGASKEVAVLGDFCVLGRRAVLSEFGGVDPSFEPGSFRGMDLSMSVARAGYELGLAQDVVVHRLRPDRDVDEEDSFEMLRFAAKWGLGDEAAGSPASPAPTTPRSTDPPPSTDEDPFHPGAPPLGIQHESPHLLLCIPDWDGGAWKGLLAAFVGAFKRGEGVGLLVRIEPPNRQRANEAVEALQAELAELGVTEEAMPEIVLEVTPLADELRPGLYTATRAFLSDGGNGDLVHRYEAEACGLPVLDSPSSETLRGLFTEHPR